MKIHASHCMVAAIVKTMKSLDLACYKGHTSILLNDSRECSNLELSSSRGCRRSLVVHLLLSGCIGKWIQTDLLMVVAKLMTDVGDWTVCRVNVVVDVDFRYVPLLLLPYFQGLSKTD